MARVRMPVVAEALDPTQVLRDKFPANGATVKFYEPGTASVVGTTTTGTPLSTSLYSGPSGGLPVSTTQTADSTGTVIVWAERPTAVGEELTCDIGVEYTAPTGAVAAVRVRERFETDPDDLVWVGDLPIFNANRPNLIGGTWYAPVVESTTAGNATTNRTRLGLLFGAVAARGGGVIRLPANSGGNFWWFDAGVVLDTGTVFAATVHLVGDGPRVSRIKLTGSSGTYFSVQPTTAVDLVRPYFMNFSVHHDTDCTSGTDFLINTDCADAYFADVEWWPDLDGAGAFTCITQKNNLIINHCRLSSRTTGTPTTINIAHTNAALYELKIYGRSILSTALSTGTIIGCNMVSPAGMDLISITNCRLSGGDYMIYHAGDGIVYQLQINGIQQDVANFAVYSTPSGVGGFRTLQFRDSWITSDEQFIAIVGGQHDNVVLDNIETNGSFQYFANITGATFTRIANCQIQLNTRPNTGVAEPSSPAASAIWLQGTNNTVEVVNNRIYVHPTLAPNAKAAVQIGSSVSTVAVHGNTINAPVAVRSIQFLGARTQSTKIGPNTIYTPNNTGADPMKSGLIYDLMTAYPTTCVLWLPSWNVTTTETTSESATGRTVTHNANLTTLELQYPLGDDRCGVAYATDKYSVITDAADLTMATSGITVAVLAQANELATDQSLVSKDDTGAEEYWLYVDSAGKLVWYLADQTAAAFIQVKSTNDAAVNGSDWARPHLWVATYTNATQTTADMAIYEDGAALATGATNSGVYVTQRNTAANLEFGAHNNHAAAFLTGRIYYVQIIPAALSALQVHALTHRLNKYFGLGL